MEKRKKYTAEFKTKVVLEVLSERYTLQEIARKYEVHPAQITRWKTTFLENASSIFSFSKGMDYPKKKEGEEERLYKIIGQQKVEIDFLKKALS